MFSVICLMTSTNKQWKGTKHGGEIEIMKVHFFLYPLVNRVYWGNINQDKTLWRLIYITLTRDPFHRRFPKMFPKI